MTQQITDATRTRIRGLLEYRNVIEAIRVYREATGCGLKDSKDAVEQIREQLRQEDPERFGGIEPVRSTRGSTLTLIGGIAVFIAILSTVYSHVFPRFSGEPLSATASLEVRAAFEGPMEHAAPMRLPDGGTWYVSKTALLTAPDFFKFNGVAGHNGEPQLTLQLTFGGQKKLSLLNESGDTKCLALIIHQKLIACVALPEWSRDGVTVSLTGLSYSDANEIFARLTE